jgi:hypothetical protein
VPNSVHEISIFDLVELQDLDPVFPVEACLTSFTICDDLNCGLELVYPELEVDGLNLKVHVDAPHAPLSGVYVGVKQPDFSWLRVPLFLEVCGNEVISPIDAEKMTFMPSDVSAGDTELTLDVTSLFQTSSPDNFCGIATYSLVFGDGSLDAPGTEVQTFVALDTGNILHIDVESTIIEFAIVAETSSGQRGWKQISVMVDQCGSQTVNLVESPYQVNVTKNSGIQTTVITQAQIDSNFLTGFTDICPLIHQEFIYPATINPNLPYAYEDSVFAPGSIFINTTLVSDEVMEYQFTAVTIKKQTEYLIGAQFDLLVRVGCFGESTIGPSFPSLGVDDYDYVFVFAQNSGVIQLPIQFDAFATDVHNCFASTLTLCEDSACATAYSSSSLYFSQNPSVIDPYNLQNATLNIDTSNTEMYQDIYIQGTTLDPTVKSIIKGKVAVCGQRFTFAAADPGSLLTVQYPVPDSNNDYLVDLSQLWAFAISNDLVPA